MIDLVPIGRTNDGAVVDLVDYSGTQPNLHRAHGVGRGCWPDGIGSRTQSEVGRRASRRAHRQCEMIMAMNSEVVVATPRLTLRLHRESDLGRLVEIYSRPDVAQYLLEGPWTVQFGKAQLERRLARTGLGEPSGALSLVVERDGLLIGAVSLWRTEQERRTVEVGWTLDPEHAGSGFASEAVTAALQLAFEHDDAHRVVAQMDARNTASARLATRVGMRQEAHFRCDFWSKGEWTDTMVFAMLDEELPPT